MRASNDIPKSNFPKTLKGFESINRYWDKQNKVIAAKILPGEYYVTKNDEMITTVLGSCIAVCMRDIKSNIGGMNHFMLPIDKAEDKPALLDKATRYGNWAMEHLINDILKAGADKEYLEIKVFGGGAVINALQTLNIGDKNILFVKNFLRQENMKVSSQDVGGTCGRKINYYPKTGEVKLKRITDFHNQTIFEREIQYEHQLVEKPIEGDVELFD